MTSPKRISAQNIENHKNGRNSDCSGESISVCWMDSDSVEKEKKHPVRPIRFQVRMRTQDCPASVLRLCRARCNSHCWQGADDKNPHLCHVWL